MTCGQTPRSPRPLPGARGRVLRRPSPRRPYRGRRRRFRSRSHPHTHVTVSEADVSGGRPIIVEADEQLMDLRSAQQRLARNAAPIDTDAAEMLAFDECGLHADLGRADRRDIAAGPAAEDDQVEG